MSSPVKRRRKTVLRTIRITKELDDALQRDANREGVALNSLLSTALTRHVEFERFADDYRIISVSRELFRAILDSTDDEKLEKATRELVDYLPRDIVAFRSIEPRIEDFVHGIETTFRYGRLAECEIKWRGDDQITISLHHDLGPKWSRTLARFLSGIARATFNTVPKIETTKTSVVATLRLDQHQRLC